MAVLSESPEVMMTKIQNSKSHYDTLLVTQACKLEDITKHYRKLCLIFHPDKNKTHGAEDVFKKVASAYEILKDSDSRRMYDQQLQMMLYRATVPVRSGFTNRPVQPRPPPPTHSAQAPPPSRSQTVWKDGKLYELPKAIKCPSCQSVFLPSSFHVSCQTCNTYLFAGVEVVQPPVHPHQRAGFQTPRPYPYVPNFDSFFPKKPSAPNQFPQSTYPHPPGPFGSSSYMHQQPPPQPPQQPVRPDFREMAVKDIKSFLEQQQVDFSDCVEKADLVRRAETVWSERQQSSTGAAPHPSTHPHHQHSHIPPTYPHPPQSHSSSDKAPNVHPSQPPQQPNFFQNREQAQNPQQRPKGPEKENIPGGNSAKKPPKKTPKKKRKGVFGGYDEELDSDVEDPDEGAKKRRATGASTMSAESMEGIDLSNIVPEGTRRSARTAATKKVSYVVPSEEDIVEVDANTYQQWSRKKQGSKTQEALRELQKLRKVKLAEEKDKEATVPSVPPSSAPSASTSPAGKSKPKPTEAKKEESSSEDDLFEVEAIVGKKVEVRGKRTTIRYQVKWKDTEDLTWEPTSHLRAVKDLIQEYEDKAAKAETTPKQEELKQKVPDPAPKPAEGKDKPKKDSDPKTDPETKKEPDTKKRPLAEVDEEEPPVHVFKRKRKAPLVEVD